MAKLIELTEAGLVRLTASEILDELVNDMITLHGEGIRDALTGDGVLGNQIGILSERINELVDGAEQIFNSAFADTAFGEALRLACANVGITAINEAHSTVTLTLTNDSGSPVTIPAGSLVKQALNNVEWETLAEVVIPANDTIDVNAQSVLAGAYTADNDNPIDTIITVISGWSEVINNGDAVPGRSAETDSQLRERRLESVVTAAAGTIEAVINAVEQVDGVVYCDGEDNRTMNTVDGLPPKSYHIIVDGGTDEAVATAILNSISAGMATYGSESITVQDSTGRNVVINFDRITSIDIYYVCNLTTDANYPADGDDQVKAALVAYGETLERGGDVYNWKAIAALNEIPGITAMTIYQGTSPAPIVSTNITIGVNERASIETARITVNS